MANEYVSKVVLSNGTTLIDLTGDTATAATVLSGSTFHDKSGAPITGTCTYDSDTSDDTAAVSEILSGKTAHARGALLTGTMANNGAQTGSITTKAQQVTIERNSFLESASHLSRHRIHTSVTGDGGGYPDCL